jgi:hypothetical protein
MATENRALAHIEKCYMKASCTELNRAGMYSCSGCIGGGQRITTKDPYIVTVETSDSGHIVSIDMETPLK